jgi:hypothetical protein
MAQTTPRWKIAAPLVLMLLLLVGWSVYWWLAVSFARNTLAAERGRIAKEISLACDSEDWGGYPYRIMFTCTGATVTLHREGATVQAPELALLVQAYNLNHIIVRLTGPTSFFQSWQNLALTARHQPAVTGIKMSGGKLLQASMRVKALTVTEGAATRFAAAEFGVQTRPSPNRGKAVDIALQGKDVTITPAPAPPVKLNTLNARLSTDKWPAGLITNFAEFARRAAGTGTQFTLDQFHADAGPVSATATGNATIMPDGTVTGALKTNVQNIEAFLDDLKARGLISKSQAKAANALLGLFTTADGVATDLRLQDGQIYWGPIKLGRQAPLF